MRFILISDIHGTVRNPVNRKGSIAESFKNKFLFLLEYASQKNAVILQAGDLTDRRRDWHLLKEMIEMLQEYKHVEIYTILGQHDTYMRSDINENPTVLSVLIQLGYIKLLTTRPTVMKVKKEKVHVYGVSWGAKIPSPKGNYNILVIHAPISKAPLWPGHQYIDAKKFTRRSKYDIVIAGDIHRSAFQKRNGTVFINTGSMMRKESTEYNFKHKPHFYMLETPDALNKVQIPHEKADSVLNKIEKKEKKREQQFEMDINLSKINIKRTNIKKVVKKAIDKEKNKLTRMIMSRAVDNELNKVK